DCTDNDREKLTKVAKKSAIQRVDEALDSVKDPMALLQYFAQGRKTLEFSSRLLHRWPSNEDHNEYRLEWASASIRDKVADQLKDDALRKIMRKLLDKPDGSASRLMFEAYVLRAFREGGYSFALKDIKTLGDPSKASGQPLPHDCGD
ncbi:hypothetical protein BGX29_003223, partial [Mortierella sp. GBA35]